MQKYSDLINEIYLKRKNENAKDLANFKSKNFYGKYGLKREDFTIDKKLSKLLDRDEGNYTIVNFSNLLLANNMEKIYLIKYLSKVIKKYLKNINESDEILVVGLGNRHINADSLGAKVVKNIIVTRHLPNVFKNMPKISAIATSVLGLTGIESGDIVESVVSKIKPKKIIIIDTFCASNYSRLATSFQINNAGITPGSGVENARKKIDKNATKIDVIVIGVPLVVYAKTIVENVLNENSFKNNLKYSNDFEDIVLTVKDVEESVNIISTIISYAINLALTNYDIKSIKEILNKL